MGSTKLVILILFTNFVIVTSNSTQNEQNSSILTRKRRQYGMGIGRYPIYPGTVGLAPNYDTALSALAFLSFGVYMLNLILTAMNRDRENNSNTNKVGNNPQVTQIDGYARKKRNFDESYGSSVSTALNFIDELSECFVVKLCGLKDSVDSSGQKFVISEYSENLLKLMSVFVDVRDIPSPVSTGDCINVKNDRESEDKCTVTEKLENVVESVIKYIGVKKLMKMIKHALKIVI